ncbi:MAG: Tim44 domain-containing protein [Alphaproteobacteria bacterium]|nr:Tim44 domain-containing protein [Alphaproteobacteria bacterium]
MSAYIDLFFLGIVVLLILFRLNNVLGTRPEQPKIKIISKQDFEKIYDLIHKENEEQEKFEDIKVNLSPAESVLSTISGFDKNDFLKRASKVFEMVLEAFASQDKETLKMLTDSKLYDKFEAIIDERKAKGITVESDLIRIETMEIIDAKVSAKGKAQIVVKFESEQINVLKDADGKLIEGDENFVQKISDTWTFEKNINTPSHVWLLTSTKKKL